MNKLLNIKELSEYLPDKPTVGTIYQWVSKRMIPYKKIGKRVLFDIVEIDKWNNNRIIDSEYYENI